MCIVNCNAYVTLSSSSNASIMVETMAAFGIWCAIWLYPMCFIISQLHTGAYFGAYLGAYRKVKVRVMQMHILQGALMALWIFISLGKSVDLIER